MKRLVIGGLAIAMIVAAYVGFRMPSAWTATLQSVSVTDGFRRRFVVGTLLRPLANATDYSYGVFATFSFLVLGAILVVLCVRAVQARSTVRAMIVIAFLLLPTGGFLFHDVGYHEQVLYLLLFLALWLVHRERYGAAAGVLAVAPFVHEIAILTVLPIFGLACLRAVSVRKAIALTAIPAIPNLVLLALAPAGKGAVATLRHALASASFPPRQDALDLFARSQRRSWRLYDVSEFAAHVWPVAVLAAVAFVAFWLAHGALWERVRGRVLPWVILVASCAAIALPGLLVYGGWDYGRWTFLVLCNFFLVLWISLPNEEPRVPARAFAVLAIAVLVFSNLRIDYFEPDTPRGLRKSDFSAFVDRVRDGSLFAVPTW